MVSVTRARRRETRSLIEFAMNTRLVSPLKTLINRVLGRFGYAVIRQSTVRAPSGRVAAGGSGDMAARTEELFAVGRDRTYGECWDSYVTRDHARLKKEMGSSWEWVGDEWGARKKTRAVFKHLFLDSLAVATSRFVELGSGAGKYSSLVLTAFPEAKLLCFDVSREFLQLLDTRCADAVAAGRLESHLIPGDDKFVLNTIESAGWRGELECFFSIDAMVHVDLQYLIGYWLTAALTLKPGGSLIMSVADATTDRGFEKLVADLPLMFPAMGSISLKFEWLSPDLVRHVLERLGFSVKFLDLNGRDCFFVATLESRPEIAW